MKNYLDLPKGTNLPIITHEGVDYVRLIDIYNACGKSTTTGFSAYKRMATNSIIVDDTILLPVIDTIEFIGKLKNPLSYEILESLVSGDYVKANMPGYTSVSERIKHKVVIYHKDTFTFANGIKSIITTDGKYMVDLIDVANDIGITQTYRDSIFSGIKDDNRLTIKRLNGSVAAKYVEIDTLINILGKRHKIRLGMLGRAVIDQIYSDLNVTQPETDKPIPEEVKDAKIGRVSGEFKTSDTSKDIDTLNSKIRELEAKIIELEAEDNSTIDVLSRIIVNNKDVIKTYIRKKVASYLKLVEFIDNMAQWGKEDEKK